MSAIILAGGISKRFGQDKGLINLAKRPLLLHVLDKLGNISNDIHVVVNSEAQKEKFASLTSRNVHLSVDGANIQTPLAGALTGFKTVQNTYTILLACDTPFIASEILRFLLDISINRDAAIPRWPNGNIEPLQAVYHAKKAADAAQNALRNNQLNMRSMISNMKKIRYVSTLVLRQFDPKLMSFFNINTPNDLRNAEVMTKEKFCRLK